WCGRRSDADRQPSRHSSRDPSRIRARGRNGVRGRLAEAAERGVAHHGGQVGERLELVVAPTALGETAERFLLTHGPDATGDALPARLVAEELGDAQDGVDEVRRLV